MKNINFMCEAIFSDKTMKRRFTATKEAAKNWCNRQFSKDENVTAKVYDKEANLLYTYHA